jgi:hypothetical protein
MEQQDDDGGDDRHRHQAEKEGSEVCTGHIRIPLVSDDLILRRPRSGRLEG